MNSFPRVKAALEYIDNNLDETISFEIIAGLFHFSPYYFHRMFSAIVGKTITVFIRDRRLEKACVLISETQRTIMDICLECGFNSAQSFSRVFRNSYGMTPVEYRKTGCVPVTTTIEEMIIKFTNRLKGGIVVNPKIIKRNELIIGGITGDGSKTGEIWQEFIKLNEKIGFANKENDNGYEIRSFDNSESKVHVGVEVIDEKVSPEFSLFKLPASQYASFDVYVARGYDSENSAMSEWLADNNQGYKQKLLNGTPYVVEYYDERFNGEEEGSIVEIWVPIEK